MLQKEWFNEILKAGVPVSIIYQNDEIWYDLNTGAKSHLHIRPTDDGKYAINTRYDGTQVVSIRGIVDVVRLVRQCMCGLDYVNDSWINLMIKHGAAEEVVIKTVKFK